MVIAEIRGDLSRFRDASPPAADALPPRTDGGGFHRFQRMVAWFLLASAILACPCLLLIVGVLFEGTAFGRYLLEHLTTALIGSTLYMVGALLIGRRLLSASSDAPSHATAHNPPESSGERYGAAAHQGREDAPGNARSRDHEGPRADR